MKHHLNYDSSGSPIPTARLLAGGHEAMTMTEPLQLTLWPDDALPGQMPLFNRRAEVGVLPEEVSGYCQRCESVVVRHFPGHLCFHCETLIAEYLASRRDQSENSQPAAEPDWELRDWFGKRHPMDVVPPVSVYL